MPAGNVLHEADALALHRVGEDHRRLARRPEPLRLLQRVHHLRHVVAVDVDDLPAEAAIAVGQRLDVHHVLHPAVDLQAIAVDDGDHVVELVVRASITASQTLPSCCSPSPMMQKIVCFLVELAGQRHAHGNAQPLAQRSAGDLDAGQLQPVRMALERRIQLAQCDHVFDGEISGEGQPEIKRGRLVSGGPDDAVAIGPLGIVGIVVGDLEVQRRNDVHHGERAAGVAGAGRAQRDQVVAAHQAGGMFQFFEVEIAHHGFGESVDQGHVDILVAGGRNALGSHRTAMCAHCEPAIAGTPISKARRSANIGSVSSITGSDDCPQAQRAAAPLTRLGDLLRSGTTSARSTSPSPAPPSRP